MNCIIPFTKEIKFNTNIAEILSISLEHEYTVNESELLGNFIITGEYKSHEVSINRESFEYVLPFSVNLTNPIDSDTLDFAIEDFTYEVLDNKSLKVNIEYSVKAMEVERSEVFEEVTPKEEEQANDILEEKIANPERNEEENIDEEKLEEEKEEDEEERVIAVPTMEEEVKEDITKEENVIMNAITSDEDNFVTYHIHIMKENETIETVCTKYNVSKDVLENYNDVKNITFGDKLLIPEIDE